MSFNQSEEQLVAHFVRRTHARTDRDEREDKRIDRRTVRRNGRTHAQTIGQKDRLKERHTHQRTLAQTQRRANGHTNRWTDWRRLDKQTCRACYCGRSVVRFVLVALSRGGRGRRAREDLLLLPPSVLLSPIAETLLVRCQTLAIDTFDSGNVKVKAIRKCRQCESEINPKIKAF